MKLLFDQNLSHRLVNVFAADFPGSIHVRELGLEKALGSAVWEFAKEHGLVIVSKDSDSNRRKLGGSSAESIDENTDRPRPFGRASLRSDFETDGRCKRSLAAIEGHELFDSHQFRCRNMDNVQTPRTVDRGMFFAEARRQAQNGRPFDCRSDQSSAMQSLFGHFSTRLPPQHSSATYAFRTSSACKGVRDKGAPVWSRYSLACDVWVSAM